MFIPAVEWRSQRLDRHCFLDMEVQYILVLKQHLEGNRWLAVLVVGILELRHRMLSAVVLTQGGGTRTTPERRSHVHGHGRVIYVASGRHRTGRRSCMLLCISQKTVGRFQGWTVFCDIPGGSGINIHYCNFTNFRCVKISVTSDHGAFGKV